VALGAAVDSLGIALGLPLAVLAAGCFTLLSAATTLNGRLSRGKTLTALYAQLSRLGVAVATLMAGAILAIVVMHMLAN